MKHNWKKCISKLDWMWYRVLKEEEKTIDYDGNCHYYPPGFYYVGMHGYYSPEKFKQKYNTFENGIKDIKKLILNDLEERYLDDIWAD